MQQWIWWGDGGLEREEVRRFHRWPASKKVEARKELQEATSSSIAKAISRNYTHCPSSSQDR